MGEQPAGTMVELGWMLSAGVEALASAATAAPGVGDAPEPGLLADRLTVEAALGVLEDDLVDLGDQLVAAAEPPLEDQIRGTLTALVTATAKLVQAAAVAFPENDVTPSSVSANSDGPVEVNALAQLVTAHSGLSPAEKLIVLAVATGHDHTLSGIPVALLAGLTGDANGLLPTLIGLAGNEWIVVTGEHAHPGPRLRGAGIGEPS